MNISITKKFNYIFFFLGIIVIISIWSLISYYENNYIFPNIIEIIIDGFKVLKEWNSIKMILFLLLKLFLAVIISYIISLILGIFAYQSIKIRKFISPFIATMRSIPAASFVIVLLLLVGSSLAPIIITLFVLIPIAYESIYSSLINCDKDVIEETKLISNINLKIICLVHIPMSFNYLISSVLTCTGLGLKVLVMGEVLAQGLNTIGGQIQFYRAIAEPVRVYSWTLILLVIVLIIEYIINVIKRRIESTM